MTPLPHDGPPPVRHPAPTALEFLEACEAEVDDGVILRPVTRDDDDRLEIHAEDPRRPDVTFVAILARIEVIERGPERMAERARELGLYMRGLTDVDPVGRKIGNVQTRRRSDGKVIHDGLHAV